MNVTNSNQLAERIEQKINPDVAGNLQVIGSGGVVNIAPKNMGELMEFAKMMSLGGPCIRACFRNQPGACLAISLQSMRWGMDPFAVSNKAYIVKNKNGEDQIAYESQLVHAVVNERAPLMGRLRAKYDGSGQTRQCTVTGTLKGETEPSVYVSPQIKDINPQNSPLWKTDPDQQLWYYSVRAWARRYVPEVLLGVYSQDEIEDAVNHQGPDNAIDVTPAPKRADFMEPKTAEQGGQGRGFTFVDHEGEIGEVPSAIAFLDAMKAALGLLIADRGDVRTFWDANADELEDVRQAFPGLNFGPLFETYHAWCDAQGGQPTEEEGDEAEGDEAPAERSHICQTILDLIGDQQAPEDVERIVRLHTKAIATLDDAERAAIADAAAAKGGRLL